MTTERGIGRLGHEGLRIGVGHLASRDPDLAAVVRLHGMPPLWDRKPGFATLLRIILEQQVSLASGKAVFERVAAHLGEVTHGTVETFGENGLRALGITRQKAGYCVGLARDVRDGSLDLGRVERSPDQSARRELMRVRGIGPWTADVYLLMALGRPDVWPAGDLALMAAIQRLRGFDARPSVEQAASIARSWSPWRSVAARILWHGYLQGSLRSEP